MSEAPLSPPGPVLVAIGPDARSLRLVHAGFRIARDQGTPWVAVHIEVPELETAEEANQARVWLQEARELGAETLWVRASSFASGLVEELKRLAPSVLLMGRARNEGILSRMGHTKAQELRRREPDLRLITVPLDSPRPGPVRTPADVLGALAASAVLLLVCAIFASALQQLIGFPAIPVVFAIGVGFITHRWGRWASIPATLLSIPVFLYLFDLPRFQLSKSDDFHFGYFLAALVVAQVLVGLMDRLRHEMRLGRRREAETVLLLLLGRALARCTTLDEVALVLSQRFQRLFQAEAFLLVSTGDGAWIRHPEAPEAPPCPPPALLLPELAPGEDPLQPVDLEGCTYLLLSAGREEEVLLQIRNPEGLAFPQEAWGSLQALAVQGALAIERIRWLGTAQQARLDQETERMRSSLLSAISHDLRTPLAAIQGAATSLLLPAEPLPETTRRDLLTMIQDESERLARLLSNLLELTRLESGVIQVRKEWQPLDEVVGAALRELEREYTGMKIVVSLPRDLPLVPLDAVLMEQLLINLLSNARRHAPGGPVELEAWREEATLELCVSDSGPGIPEEIRERIFDKFFRLPGSDGGVGLGLAICEAVARCHGGRIWAESSRQGGAAFRVSLPLEGEPPVAPLEVQP